MADPVVLLAATSALVGIGAYGFASALARATKRVRNLRAVAEECGLTDLVVPRVAILQRRIVRGRFEPHAVSIREHRVVLDGETARIEIQLASTSIVGDLALQPERRLQDWQRSGKIELGEPAFDAAYLLAGDGLRARALFDAGVRRRLMQLHELADVELVAGSLTAGLRMELPGTLRTVLPPLLSVARRLNARGSLQARLGRNARRDPVAAVRLNSLRCLIREGQPDEETRKTLHAACKDESMAVRLRAAVALGPEGQAVLLDIAERATDDSCVPDAIEALDGRIPPDRIGAILHRGIQAQRTAVGRACIRWLGRHAGHECVATLTAILAGETPSLAADAAEALGDMGASTAETDLIAALLRPPVEVPLAASKALGRVGSAAAIPALGDAAAAHPSERDLQRAIHQAIADIQARLTGASPGQLSLSGSASGQLSVADGEDGHLTIVPSPPKDGGD